MFVVVWQNSIVFSFSRLKMFKICFSVIWQEHRPSPKVKQHRPDDECQERAAKVLQSLDQNNFIFSMDESSPRAHIG